MLFYGSENKVVITSAVNFRRWATGPPFLVLFFGFYQSMFREHTLLVVGGELTINGHINFKWYRNGQPKARV